MAGLQGYQRQDGVRAPASLGMRDAVRTVEADEPATLTLDQRGMICDCNAAAERLFHYGRGEMVWRYVSMLLPQLAETPLAEDGEANPRLRFLCRIGRRFAVRTREGREIPSDLFINVLDNGGRQRRIVLIVRPASAAEEPAGVDRR